MSDWLGILWLVLLLAMNAFFVASEFAVMSARRSQIEPLADAGSKRAKVALYAMEHVSLMLACSQLGITVASLLILNVAEPAIKHLVLDPLVHIGVPYEIGSPVVFVLVLLLVTFLHVTFGEMVPKNISVSIADKAVLFLAAPLVFVSRIAHPVVAGLNWLANHIVRAFRITPKDEVTSAFTLKEVQSIVAESTKEGTVEDSTGLLSGALEFSSRTAADVMTGLSDLVTLKLGASARDVEEAVQHTGYSRFIILDEDGEPDSYVHVKDVLGIDESEYERPLSESLVRTMVNVSETEEIEDALRLMQRTGSHLARVVNDRGMSVGVLFLEDIIEELVGEIRERTRS